MVNIYFTGERVGKTSLISKIINWNYQIRPTIGVEYTKYGNNFLWDIGSKDFDKCLALSYIKKNSENIVMFCISLDDFLQKNYNFEKYSVNDIQNKKYLIITKIDEVKNYSEYCDKINNFAKENEFCKVIFTSAKENIVQDLKNELDSIIDQN